jgi:diguanylate cyclase (GGDEF)-like protein
MVADSARILVPGAMRVTSWDIAGEAVEEALRTDGTPSLERLGRLGQLGSLPLVVEAARAGEDAGPSLLAHARERRGLGFGATEAVAEALALGRVLERRGDRAARVVVDRAVTTLVDGITDELADRARRDPLTGLLNHRAFHTAVAEEVARARRYRGSVALVLFDLDRFKELNDTLGHQEGDRLLRAFAAALTRTLRENDRAGRLGGDEFGALLVQADTRAVHALQDRLERALPAGLATSAGAAFVSEIAGSAAQLFELADTRLYADKLARAA